MTTSSSTVQPKPQRAIIYLSVTAVFALVCTLTRAFPWQATQSQIDAGRMQGPAWEIIAWVSGFVALMCIVAIVLHKLHLSKVAAALACAIPIICSLELMLMFIATAKGEAGIEEVHIQVWGLFAAMVAGAAAAKRMRSAMQAEEFALEALKG